MADTPARRLALLRLLEDWEAGRMTLSHSIPYDHFFNKGLIAETFYLRRRHDGAPNHQGGLRRATRPERLRFRV